MPFDKKLDVEHLYAGKKKSPLYVETLTWRSVRIFFFVISLIFLCLFGSKTETKFQSVLNTVQCFVSEQHLFSFKNFFHNVLRALCMSANILSK